MDQRRLETGVESQNSGGGGASVSASAMNKDRYFERVYEESQIIDYGVFPANLWFEDPLAEYLSDDPKSMEILINSSPYFRELFKNKRVLALSKSVFKIFINWKYPRFLTYRNGYMALFEILKLRQVCSSWCSSLDQLLREELIMCKDIDCLEVNTRRGDPLERTLFASKFLQHFQGTHSFQNNKRSPFLGSYLIVTVFHQEDWNEWLKILREYGHHILHLRFLMINLNEHAVATPQQQVYLHFREMLMLTPNLQSLRVTLPCEETAAITQQFVGGHPLPTLENLKMLATTSVSPCLFTNLLHNNTHVSFLNVNKNKRGYNFDVDMENLKELRIDASDDDTSCNLGATAVGQWPLEKLSWLNSGRDNDGNLLWREVFDTISDNWGHTLEELELRLPVPSSNERAKRQVLQDSCNCRLNLPKVKVLRLDVANTICTLDFLLGLNLNLVEGIYIKNCYQLAEKRQKKADKPLVVVAKTEQIIEVVGYEKRMHESNIWILFKKLKKLKVNKKLYRRPQSAGY